MKKYPHQIKKAALVACSNGLAEKENENIRQLIVLLQSLEIDIAASPYLYAAKGYAGGSAKERAAILNQYFQDKSMDAIFDLSGGDMANELLPYLDYDAIQNSNATFFGYSDLTTILNAIYSQTGKSSVLYQVRNLIRDESGCQREHFRKFLQCINDRAKNINVPEQTPALFQAHWSVLQGEEEDGFLDEQTILGGNIRCLLKLAGTKYFPDFKNKVLFLEAMSGSVPQISTYMAQLYQLGIFAEVKAVLLGTFLQMEKESCSPSVYDIMKPYLPHNLYVAQTSDIGHNQDSSALWIG